MNFSLKAEVEQILNRYELNEVVIQPGTFCNLACDYCYLQKASRDAKRFISPALLNKLAASLSALALKKPVSILYHAGEPLAVGIERFRDFVQPFEGLRRAQAIRYSLQTNGTLIDERWCAFFKEHNVGVGVSIDGPAEFCGNRVTRLGVPAYKRIVSGIEKLRGAGIPFGCIAVLSAERFQPGNSMADLAARIHRYFSWLRPVSVGFNIEERENANLGRRIPMEASVYAFWYHLYHLWTKDRQYDIRDLSRAERFAQLLKSGTSQPFRLSLIPTVDVDGNVYFFSPEIVGTKAIRYGDFIVGNLSEVSLEEMIARIEEVPYVRDFIEGVNQCRATCPVFDTCQSRHVLSNKFAEHGDLHSTETIHCRNTYIAPLQAVVSAWAAADGPASSTKHDHVSPAVKRLHQSHDL